MVCPVFYHNNADGHTDACSSMDDPVVLFGVYNLPHQHHGLASAERRRQAKRQLDTAKTRFRIYASFLFFFCAVSPSKTNSTSPGTDPGPTLTSIPKIGWQGKMKPR